MHYINENVVPPELNFKVDFSQYNPMYADGPRLLPKCAGAPRAVPQKWTHPDYQPRPLTEYLRHALFSSIADNPLFAMCVDLESGGY